jgi:hypothetical protein
VTRKVAREKGIMGGHESGEQALKWTEKWENSFKRGQAFKSTKQKKRQFGF